MCRRRNGPRRQRTPDLLPPGRRPGTASVWSREKRLGPQRARPSFLGRHRDRADALEFQAQILDELAHLAGTASQPGQLKDAFTRFGHGASGLLLEGLADQVAISGHFAHWAIGIPLPQAIQIPLSKRGHVPLDGGSTGSDDLGRVLALDPVVQQPKDQHLFPDPRVGMRAPFLVNDSLLLLGQPYAKPSHGEPPCVRTRSRRTSLLASHRNSKILSRRKHVHVRYDRMPMSQSSPCGVYRQFAPTEVDPNSILINQPLGKDNAEQLALSLGLNGNLSFSQSQYVDFIA